MGINADLSSPFRRFLAEKSAELPSPFMTEFSSMGLRANALLKQNIDALLRHRGQTRKDLAFFCRRTEAWISKIFNTPARELPLKYIDRIADFFGMLPYQLYVPGIATSSERRSGRDRRRGKDRRLGVSKAQAEIQTDHEIAHPRGRPLAPAEVALIRKLRHANPEERDALLYLAGVREKTKTSKRKTKGDNNVRKSSRGRNPSGENAMADHSSTPARRHPPAPDENEPNVRTGD